MKKKIFSIFDSKAKFYGPIFMKDQVGEAERDFSIAVNDPKSGLLHQFPEDFDLFWLGEYDNQTGACTSLTAPQHVVKGASLRESTGLSSQQ